MDVNKEIVDGLLEGVRIYQEARKDALQEALDACMLKRLEDWSDNWNAGVDDCIEIIRHLIDKDQSE